MSFNDLLFMKLLSNKCLVGRVKKHTDNGYNSTLLALTIVFFLLQPDGTDLFHFVQGCSSWDAYLRSMMTDGTWGDHVILHGAANCFDTCIHVISCLPHHRDVIHLLLFITRKYAFVCVKRRPTAQRYIH